MSDYFYSFDGQEGLQAHYEKRRGIWKHTYSGKGTDVVAGAPNVLGIQSEINVVVVDFFLLFEEVHYDSLFVDGTGTKLTRRTST